MEPGLIEKAIYTGKVASYPNGVHVCELEIDEDTGDGRDRRTTTWSTTSAP